jgi:hypothetical protein
VINQEYNKVLCSYCAVCYRAEIKNVRVYVWEVINTLGTGDEDSCFYITTV